MGEGRGGSLLLQKGSPSLPPHTLFFNRQLRVEAVAGDIVESLCRDVAGWLRSDGLSDADGDWLVEHGPSVQARIETPELQRMSVMLE